MSIAMLAISIPHKIKKGRPKPACQISLCSSKEGLCQQLEWAATAVAMRQLVPERLALAQALVVADPKLVASALAVVRQS